MEKVGKTTKQNKRNKQTKTTISPCPTKANSRDVGSLFSLVCSLWFNPSSTVPREQAEVPLVWDGKELMKFLVPLRASSG